jgi:tripartite-type tricarboxylate transporter receptor subunit TctC
MMINPFAAGSAVDVVARQLAQRMAQNLGQPFKSASWCRSRRW